MTITARSPWGIGRTKRVSPMSASDAKKSHAPTMAHAFPSPVALATIAEMTTVLGAGAAGDEDQLSGIFGIHFRFGLDGTRMRDAGESGAGDAGAIDLFRTAQCGGEVDRLTVGSKGRAGVHRRSRVQEAAEPPGRGFEDIELRPAGTEAGVGK